MVEECSDCSTQPKPPWRERKEKYVKNLATKSPDSLLVSVADKLHNGRTIVQDVEQFGKKTWKRFNASPKDIVWYYESVLKALKKRKSEGGPGFAAALDELEQTVKALKFLPT